MKETKELVIAFIQIAALLADEFKDGVQATDFVDIGLKIQANEELKAKLLAAYNDIEKVPAELKAINLAEALDLGAAAIPELLNLFKAVKA